jgi:hypothetical protein
VTDEWKVHYWRYQVKGTETTDSLGEALSFCVAGTEYGGHSASAIIAPSGEVIDGDRLSEMMYAYETDRLDDDWLADNWPEMAARRKAEAEARAAKLAHDKATLSLAVTEFKAATGVDLGRFASTGLSVVLSGGELRAVVQEIVDKALLP